MVIDSQLIIDCQPGLKFRDDDKDIDKGSTYSITTSDSNKVCHS